MFHVVLFMLSTAVVLCSATSQASLGGRFYRCRCHVCGVNMYKFAPWHPDVLRTFPRHVVDMMPALIRHHSTVGKQLLVRLEQTMCQKTGIATLVTNLEESHKIYFWDMASR